MLLPPDLRDWVPDEDMVHFVIEALAGMNLPMLKINRRGCGSPQYPPKMMLQRLLYCYANGIFSSRRIERMEKDGKDLYVAVSRNAGNWQRGYDFRPESVTARREKNVTDIRMLAMKEKLSSEEGKRIYAKRKHTVEPVFGIIKQVMGYRQTLLRGFEKVNGDWGLVCLAYNFKRLFALQTA